MYHKQIRQSHHERGSTEQNLMEEVALSRCKEMLQPRAEQPGRLEVPGQCATSREKRGRLEVQRTTAR